MGNYYHDSYEFNINKKKSQQDFVYFFTKVFFVKKGCYRLRCYIRDWIKVLCLPHILCEICVLQQPFGIMDALTYV